MTSPTLGFPTEILRPWRRVNFSGGPKTLVVSPDDQRKEWRDGIFRLSHRQISTFKPGGAERALKTITHLKQLSDRYRKR